MRRWYSDFVKNFSFFFSRIDFIAHSLHGAQLPITESVLNDIVKMLAALVDAADKQTKAIGRVKEKFEAEHPDAVKKAKATALAKAAAAVKVEAAKVDLEAAKPAESEKAAEYALVLDAFERSGQQWTDLTMYLLFSLACACHWQR